MGEGTINRKGVGEGGIAVGPNPKLQINYYAHSTSQKRIFSAVCIMSGGTSTAMHVMPVCRCVES